MNTGLNPCMEGDNIMPCLGDRRRLKDRIVESVSKAVKQIQEFQFCSGRVDVTLTNNDWQFCKLVEHLDHAFLHGLRHITNGYWVVVQEFTHKATVKEIKHLTNVTTNLGRGRAWLYVALSEHLLESYLNCFADHAKMVRRYYVKEALVLDQQRMQILLTLSAGLEHVGFQLDLDVPYLDLSSSLRPRKLSREDSDDRLSLCSMDSSLSHSSSLTADLSSLSEQGDGATHGITDLSRDSPKDNAIMMASSGDNGIVEAEEAVIEEQSRIKRFSQIPCTPTLDLDTSSDTLEVIRVRTKIQKSKKKKSQKKKGESSGESMTPSPLSPEGNGSALLCNGYISDNASVDTGTSSLDQDHVDGPVKHSPSNEVLKDDPQSWEHSRLQINPVPAREGTEQKDEKHDSGCELSPHFSSFSQHAHDIEQRLQSLASATGPNNLVTDLAEGTQVAHSTEPTSVAGLGETPLQCKGEIVQGKEQSPHSCDEQILQTSSSHTAHNNCQSSSNSQQSFEEKSKTLLSSEEKAKSDAPPVQEIQSNDSCKNNSNQTCEEKTNSSESCENDSDAICKENLEQSHGEETETQSCTSTKAQCCDMTSGTKDTRHEAEVRVDNNLLLLLMLHIFDDDDEHLLKLYQTSLGHTEGELQPVGLLLTTHAIYILTAVSGEFRYAKEATIHYKELDYISLGVYYQMINIVCTNRRKQFWITTGDEQLTRGIVSQLDTAVRNSDLDLPRLSVLTDATTQKIALRKWAAQECQAEVSDVAIGCYVLVHWDDIQPGASTSTGRKDIQPGAGGISREGVLLYKTQGGLGGLGSLVPVFAGSAWKPSFFVLKDGILYQYADKHDNSVPKMCVQLNGEDCGGCRRSLQSDRDHCFELILSDGSALQMSAASDQEAQEWLQSLCQAVSEGMGVRVPGSGLLACCVVLTQSRLLLCHEDVQTNFFRTLGGAEITDVTAVLTDPGLPFYAVVVFESQEAGVSSELWTLHFNATEERDRFMTALMSLWSQHFQVELPVSQVTDVLVQKRCRESHARLKAAKKI